MDMFFTGIPKVKKNFVIAESIELNKAYWFRHEYVDPVIFEEDSSIAFHYLNI